LQINEGLIVSTATSSRRAAAAIEWLKIVVEVKVLEEENGNSGARQKGVEAWRTRRSRGSEKRKVEADREDRKP